MKNLEDAETQLVVDAKKLMLKTGQVSSWLDRARRLGTESIRHVHAKLDNELKDMCRFRGHDLQVVTQMKRLKLRLKDIIENSGTSAEQDALMQAA